MNHVQLVVVVTGRELEEEFDQCFHKQGLPVVLSSLGHGTVPPGILDLMGLANSEKAVMFALGERSAARRAMRALTEMHGLNLPGRGIAFALPVASLDRALAAQTGACAVKQEEEEMETPYELILSIIQKGNSEHVMDAARSAGATGGTILHAKGTGVTGARKFFGMSLADEREMVFIVVPQEDKAQVMRAIIRDAGANSPAQALVLSLPITEAAGLHGVAQAEEKRAE